MGAGSKVVYLRGSAIVRFERVAELACKRLQMFLERMFDGADDALFDLSGRVTAGDAYFDAMRQLRLRRRDVETAFAREMRARVKAVSAAGPELSPEPGGDGTDLELDLAVETMIAKARAYRSALTRFRESMTRLLPYSLANERFPFDPQSICTAFRSAAHVLDLDIKARLVIFKMFERHVIERLPELYHEFNEWSGAADETPQRGFTTAEEAELDAVLADVFAGTPTEGAASAPIQGDALGFLAMLFDAILSDPALPAPIKALIGRLQHPLLKRILKGEDPFRNREHPARQFIDAMANAAVGWTEPAEPRRDPLYRTLEMLVERVLEAPEGEADVFEEVLGELRAFLAEEQQRAERIAVRTQRTAEGKARVDTARARVNEELARRLQGSHISDTARALLSQGWAKVLFIAYLQDEPEGASFQRALSTADRLLWSLTPKPDARSRRDLLQELPSLLRELREGLDSVLLDPFETHRLLEALEQEHRQALLSVGAEPDLSWPDDVAESTESRCDADVLGRVQALPVGAWLEFRQGDEAPQRAQLAARLSESGRLIFVDRAGAQLVDMTPEALAEALVDGSASVLEVGNLFDKALRTVVANLRALRPH